jgi:hypothetical protein
MAINRSARRPPRKPGPALEGTGPQPNEAQYPTGTKVLRLSAVMTLRTYLHDRCMAIEVVLEREIRTL